MIINQIGLLKLLYLVLVITYIIGFTVNPIAFAEIGDSKSKIDERYGESSLIQDEFHRTWTQSEWMVAAKGDAKVYGYMKMDGEMNITNWFTYNQKNLVTKETVLMDRYIKIRDLKKHFQDVYDVVARADSVAFVLQNSSKRQLAVLTQNLDQQFKWVRFFMDRDEKTKINMHSKFHGFEITDIDPHAVKNYLNSSKVPLLPSSIGQQVHPDDNWQRTDNYFQSEIFFADPLVGRKKTDMITIHHTAIEEMSVADIHEMHLEKGWSGIAYHKVILPDGTIEKGRPESMIGAHALGVNPRSIGIVLVGNFEIAPPSSAQMDALVKLTLELMKRYHIPLENVLPHRDVTKGTVCPGNLFPWEEFVQRLK